MNKNKIIILASVLVIFTCIWILFEYLQINKLDHIIENSSKSQLLAELVLARKIHKQELKSEVFGFRNNFTIRHLIKQVNKAETKSENKKLYALLIMLSSVDMYEKYKKDLDDIFYKALKNNDVAILKIFTDYYSNIATKQVLNQLIQLTKLKATAFRSMLTLTTMMRYDIKSIMKMSKDLDSTNIIIILTGVYKKLSQKKLSKQANSYYKELIGKYNELIVQRIKNPLFFKSLSSLPKIILAQVWLDNDLHLSVCRSLLNSITVSKLEREYKVDYLIAIATLEIKSGKYELAKKYLEEALKYDSSNSKIYFNLAIVCSQKGNWLNGSKFMEKYLDLVYGKDWISVIKKNNEEQDVWNIAFLWKQAEIKPKEVEDLLKYLVYKRQNLEAGNSLAYFWARNLLAYFWAEKGIELKEAESLIKQVIAKYPKEGAYIDTYGYILFKQKKYKAALKEFLKANALQLDNTVIKEHLGDVYQKLGKTKESKKYWKEALKLLKKEKFNPYNQKFIKKINAKLKNNSDPRPIQKLKSKNQRVRNR